MYGHYETSADFQDLLVWQMAQRNALILILANDLGYGDTASLAATLQEASRLLKAHVAAVLTPGS